MYHTYEPKPSLTALMGRVQPTVALIRYPFDDEVCKSQFETCSAIPNFL